MKKIYVGVLLASMLAQPVLGMQEDHKDINTKNIVARSPEEQEALNTELIKAVIFDDLSGVEKLIKQGADVNAGGKSGRTALHWACIQNNIPLVKLLVLYANVNAIDGDGMSVFGTACSRNNSEIITILLDCKDIQVNVVDFNGKTPLHNACFLGRIELVKALLKKLVRPAINWQHARLVFMGHQQKDCNFAKLPLEMIYYILSFCGDHRKNIEELKSFICHRDKDGWAAFNNANDYLKKELGHVLDPQAWKDDETAEKTYAQLLTLLKEDDLNKKEEDDSKKRKSDEKLEIKNKKMKTEQPEENGKQEE